MGLRDQISYSRAVILNDFDWRPTGWRLPEWNVPNMDKLFGQIRIFKADYLISPSGDLVFLPLLIKLAGSTETIETS